MKSNLILRVSSLLFFSFLFTQICTSQLYENTIGNLAGSDETTDIKPLPNGHTAVLANTTSFGAKKILLMELDPLGHVIFFKTIYNLTNPDEEYTGTNLALDMSTAGIHIGYFITGCRGSYPTQMILIHTDITGNPTWAWKMDNGLIGITNHVMSECGVSIERQRNTDVIVVGRSDQMGDLRFTASRFSAAGVLLWSNRYSSPRGLQFLPNESCNGFRDGTEVVAVVGHIHTAGIGHTFLSCIKASNGLEIWRRQYVSEQYHDDGTDVVQNPADGRYMVVGHAENLGGGGTLMWAFNANGGNGALTNGATYSLLPPYHNLFARDVCLSPDKISGTIAGFVDIDPTAGAAGGVRTFIMKLPFAPGALPVFCHYFTASDPQLFLFGDDAIETVDGPNPGYVLGTEAILPGSAAGDYDVHALRLNVLGLQNYVDCPVVPFTPDIKEEGRSSNIKREKTASTWSNFIVAAQQQEFLENPCIEFVPPNVMDSVTVRASSSFETRIFPNPAIAGSEINIQFELPKTSVVEIQLLDISGKMRGSWKEMRDEGKQVMQITLPANAVDEMYFIKIILSGGQTQVQKLLVN